MNKRSISPLIATILLIVVSVILITVVLTWGSAFTKDNLNQTNSILNLKESDLSSFISVVSYTHLENISNIVIRNLHGEKITFVGYKLISEDIINPEKLYSFPNIINIDSGGVATLNLICFPKANFILQLITDDLEYVSLSINIKNYNMSYCSEFSDLFGYFSFDGDFLDYGDKNYSNIYSSGEFLGDFKNQHLSFNGSTDYLVLDNKTKVSLIDYTTWEIGTEGSQLGFNQTGSTTENSVSLDSDPWGREIPIWRASPDSVSGPDGGWATKLFPIDNTKLYRFSVWMNREVIGFDGRFYFGVFGYDLSKSFNGVYRLTNVLSTNPYFFTSYYVPSIYEDEWILYVSHVFPHDYSLTTKHINSGGYTLENNKFSSSADYKWSENNGFAVHRTYLYYTTDTSAIQKWAYPRADLVDGNEPSIADLLSGYDSNNFGITDSISLSFWLKIDSFNEGTIISKTKNNILESCYDLKLNSDGYILFSIDQSEISSNESINIDDWFFISATYNKEKMKLYINGELNSELEKTTPIKVSIQETTIGVKKFNDTYEAYFLGYLDDVRIYGKALKDLEIYNLYISTNPEIGESD
jgi:hypothetical protein